MGVNNLSIVAQWVPLDFGGDKFFGFSEYLAALALMILVWTIGDVRYRFRIQTAPFPLIGTTFVMVVILGVLTLLTDLWRNEQWVVPSGSVLTPGGWQALLGGAFFITFVVWAWVAFIRPPVFGRMNAKRYGRTLYRTILKGNPSELSVAADELGRSAKKLIAHAQITRSRRKSVQNATENSPKVSLYANDILLLISDKRFCREIVSSSPGTLLKLFAEVGESEKYDINIATFYRNIVTEALHNQDSFIYHETNGFDSGLIGYHKPLSQALFSNYRMVESFQFLADTKGFREWDIEKIKAYHRIVLMLFEDFISKDFWGHPFVIYRAFSDIEFTLSLYQINGTKSDWNNPNEQKLRAIIDFLCNAIKILHENGVPDGLKLRIRKNDHPHETFYDHIARAISEVIFEASHVVSPHDLCWWIQHNSVWSEFFHDSELENDAGTVIKFKVRRLIYDEIVRMNKYGNYKGARILGLCLNVMGFELRKEDYDKDTYALHAAVLSWTRENFAKIYEFNPSVGEACLVDGIAYDAENNRLTRTISPNAFRKDPEYVHFDLKPNSSGSNDKE